MVLDPAESSRFIDWLAMESNLMDLQPEDKVLSLPAHAATLDATEYPGNGEGVE